ncbi:L-rhamnose mutarotase [Paenibacillus silvisoli]|uniref:L-rhamnose mutarotase n=1 Tax=Paenibacillus silvisoli TaxID=3110539 RepID=UPI0028043DC3|nr:L-rhamnose mutarotase [Paenibacillus silvisoli]
MNSTKTTIFKVAKLHPNKVDLYQQLHDEIPPANLKHMQEAGIVSLRIFREGSTLFMVVESDMALEMPNRVVDQAVEERWKTLTGECFAEFWQDAGEIYIFSRKED